MPYPSHSVLTYDSASFQMSRVLSFPSMSYYTQTLTFMIDFAALSLLIGANLSFEFGIRKGA